MTWLEIALPIIQSITLLLLAGSVLLTVRTNRRATGSNKAPRDSSMNGGAT